MVGSIKTDNAAAAAAAAAGGGLGKKGKLGAYVMKRVAAGTHLSTSCLFEPTKRRDDRDDYCLGCSFFPIAPTLGPHFLQLSGLWRALGANSGAGSAQ